MDVEHRLRQLELIHRVSKRMAASLVLEDLLQEVVRSICDNFNYFQVMILTVEEGQERIVLRAQAGRGPRQNEGYWRPMGEGIVGLVASSGRTVLANDVSREPAYREARPETRSELCVPILLEGGVLGVINAEADQLNAFGADDQLVLETIADQLAGVIRNAGMYHDCKVAKDHLERLIENSSDAISTADRHGRITFWSHGAEAIFGYSAPEAIGMNVDDFYAGGHEEARRMMRLLRQKGKLSNWEAEYVAKDGRRFPGSLSISLLRDEAGRPAGTLGIIRDISEVRELQQQLLQAERLAAIGSLTSQLAHELRNPLSSVKMNINILSKKLAGSGTEAQYLQLAAGGVEKLEAIVGEMVDFVRPFHLSPATCDPRRILDAAVRQALDFTGSKDIDIERSYAPTPLTILADPVRLEQALVNLCANSLQAMAGGGRLTLGCRADPGAIDQVEISVADTGRGIRPEHLDRVFEPFFTTRSDGTGLGLSIVRKIVELHEGRVSVQSSEGQGTRFTIELPVKPGFRA